jgi:hypothetical protein
MAPHAFHRGKAGQHPYAADEHHAAAVSPTAVTLNERRRYEPILDGALGPRRALAIADTRLLT